MSSFLMGCYDPESKKWCTVTKCSGGYDDATLARLQKELDVLKISKVEHDLTGIGFWDDAPSPVFLCQCFPSGPRDLQWFNGKEYRNHMVCSFESWEGAKTSTVCESPRPGLGNTILCINFNFTKKGNIFVS